MPESTLNLDLHWTSETVQEALEAAAAEKFPTDGSIPVGAALIFQEAYLRGASAAAAVQRAEDQGVIDILVRQLADARELLPLIAEHGDDHLHDEFSSVLEDGPTDDNGTNLIDAEIQRRIAERNATDSDR